MHDFDVIAKMVTDNKDIALFLDMIEANKTKGGFKITFGVPEAVGFAITRQMGLGTNEYMHVMIRVNKQQFDEIKKANP